MKILKTLYTSDHCKIYHNEELNIVQTEWKETNCEGEEFRKILDKIIDALREIKTSVILADTRRMAMIWKEDREWIVKDWYPRAIKAGFRCQALIVTEDSYNELALKEIIEQYDDQVVETAYFTSFSDAFVWVKTKMLSGTSI
jgi:hypothetical protein